MGECGINAYSKEVPLIKGKQPSDSTAEGSQKAVQSAELQLKKKHLVVSDNSIANGNATSELQLEV